MGLFDAFVDDLVGIPDGAVLYRRVSWGILGGDKKCMPGQAARLSGNAFADYRENVARELDYPGPCMSVAVSTVLTALRLPPSKVVESYPGYGLARVRAADLRNLSRADGSACPQGLMLAPTKKEPWHCVVFDPQDPPRKGSVQKAIARVAEWELPLIRV